MMAGNFFAVDRPHWQTICPALDMNASVAYLILARFSGYSNSTTSASVNAVENYSEISRGRARQAIETLLSSKKIIHVSENSFPKYDLIPGVEKPDWIWLPNQLVTGAGEETPPIERVRETSDVMTLRLFIDLYHTQNLREDCGVSRSILWQLFDREKIGQRGEFDIYGFKLTHRIFRWEGPFVCHNRTLTKEEQKAGVKPADECFSRLQRLEDSGLLEFVPYLFESDTTQAEPIHPVGMKQTDSLEDQIGAAAHKAGLSFLTAGQQEHVKKECFWVVPVPRHITGATIIGVARLRYRARSRMTTSWWGELNRKGRIFLDKYQSLLTGSKERKAASGG